MKSIINGVVIENENIDNWKKKGYVYEVLRVIDNNPLFLKEHLLRMKNSVDKIDTKLIENDLKKLIKIYGKLNDNIFLSVNIEKNEIGIFVIKGFYPPKEWYENGIKINTCKIKRDDPGRKVYDINYKNIIQEYLKQTDVFETLITDKGVINEGSRSNVFFIKGNEVYTPTVEAVLPGITRDKVFEAAKDCAITIVETYINTENLNTFDGAFITGTSIDLLPIRQIDDIQYKTAELYFFKRLVSSFETIKNKDLGIVK